MICLEEEGEKAPHGDQYSVTWLSRHLYPCILFPGTNQHRKGQNVYCDPSNVVLPFLWALLSIRMHMFYSRDITGIWRIGWWGQITFGWSTDLQCRVLLGSLQVWLDQKCTADWVWILLAIIMFAEVFLFGQETGAKFGSLQGRVPHQFQCRS